MKSAKEYRMESKAALKGNWAMAILTCLLFDLISGALASTFLGLLLLSGVLTVGMSIAFVNLYRKERIEIGDLFAGFSGPNLSATIGLYIKTTIFTLLWSLLFVIPGIIARYRYQLAPYILADHPELTGGEAITASKKLMKGKKWKLFCLDFSFIGWLLLSILTFGILLLWVGPWMNAATAAFYESVKDEVVLPEKH